MAASVRFERGGWQWLAERESVLFAGETAMATFVAFESDTHHIAYREFVSRLGGEPPILLIAADIAP